MDSEILFSFILQKIASKRIHEIARSCKVKSWHLHQGRVDSTLRHFVPRPQETFACPNPLLIAVPIDGANLFVPDIVLQSAGQRAFEHGQNNADTEIPLTGGGVVPNMVIRLRPLGEP
jgi:hypothetical protein